MHNKKFMPLQIIPIIIRWAVCQYNGDHREDVRIWQIGPPKGSWSNRGPKMNGLPCPHTSITLVGGDQSSILWPWGLLAKLLQSFCLFFHGSLFCLQYHLISMFGRVYRCSWHIGSSNLVFIYSLCNHENSKICRFQKWVRLEGCVHV